MSNLEHNLHAVQRGELSLEQAAKDADVSIYDALELARAKGMEIGLNEQTLKYELNSLRKKIDPDQSSYIGKKTKAKKTD